MINNQAMNISSLFFNLYFTSLLLFGLFSSRKKKGKGFTGKRDEDKVNMGIRIVELEKVNNDLRDRLRNLEMEYLERQEAIKNKESELESKTGELDEGLKEVYALKMMIDEYRLKVSRLKNENSGLEKKVADLSAKLKEGKKKYDTDKEIELKKIADEKEEIKEKAKTMVVAFQKETEEKISGLEKENNDLKDRIKNMKEKYSAWEAIEGL